MPTIFEQLRNSLSGPSEAYKAKQLHPVPDAKVVVRETFILSHCEGKNVVELGASGRMHEEIVRVAKMVVGIDRHDSPGVIGFDLDDVSRIEIPVRSDFDWNVIVAGEVLEHLSNQGHVLDRLKFQFPRVPLIVTVPNAFADAGRRSLERGIENVNLDHVAYYSYWTLKALLERAGYTINEFYWYNGRPKFAEGMIVVAE